jgi:hypothetical protein
MTKKAWRSARPVVRFTVGPDDEVVTVSTRVPEYGGETLTSAHSVGIRYERETPTKVWVDGHDEQGSVLGVLFLLTLSLCALYQVVR